MELHPFWEKGGALNSELWYVLSAVGDHPSIRVGHTATYLPNPSTDGKVYFISGANPDGQLAEVYTLDLETFSWDFVDCKDFKGRYEHIAYVPDSEPGKVYTLLGAEKTGNVNDVQVFDTADGSWEVKQFSGPAPSARTHHTTAQLGDRVYVYTGGLQGSDPVPDQQVYCFVASTSTWSSFETENAPKPRQGHVLLAYNNQLVLHGGLAGQSFFEDLHVLDLDTKIWRDIKQRKIYPTARAAHGGTVVGASAYIFGGLGINGALDDLWKLDLGNFKWQKINLQGPAPTPRLDFAMTCITARIPVREARPELEDQTRLALEKLGELTVDENSGRNRLGVSDSPPGVAVPNPTPNTERYGLVRLILVHGGMDTDGEIWDDTLVFLVDNE